MLKRLTLFAILSVSGLNANATSTAHYCDELCRKPDGTYFQVRCSCKTVNGAEVLIAGSCGSGCQGGKLVTSGSSSALQLQK